MDEHGSRHERLVAIVVPVLVLAVPLTIALITDNVLILASITGSYPGVGVQFVIPCLLVIAARRVSRQDLRLPVPSEQASPFQHIVWPVLIFLWSAFTFLIVTYNLIRPPH